MQNIMQNIIQQNMQQSTEITAFLKQYFKGHACFFYRFNNTKYSKNNIKRNLKPNSLKYGKPIVIFNIWFSWICGRVEHSIFDLWLCRICAHKAPANVAFAKMLLPINIVGQSTYVTGWIQSTGFPAFHCIKMYYYMLQYFK